ncbi:tetratricopeptide repeat protein [Alloscardovia macacae]|uniref:tetratricopeptide repeat protein n=1 Tax=Alloscardovia macacae TaxID=1160091 RepID=UPI0011D08D18|nr:tetratricopeptide repeat protein [Alloscardovia macacae]
MRFFTARHMLTEVKLGEHTFRVGWMHDPLRMTKNRVALGIFTPEDTFVPVAVASMFGAIYETAHIEDDLTNAEPRVRVVSEGDGHVHAYRFLKASPSETNSFLLPVYHGSVIARSEDGRLRWLSSWMRVEDELLSEASSPKESSAQKTLQSLARATRHTSRYTFEQLRSNALSPQASANLEYKDAMVLAYFVAYAQPTLAADVISVMGFGTSNIYRRLRQQAPLSAIRRSVADSERARAAGLRVTGLEEYFTHMMRESGALERIPRLEAKHAQENLELMTNPRSHLYYLHSRNGVDFQTALKTLRIETNLNRFTAVSSVIENNYHYDFTPTEDMISLPYVAKLSADLLENPAFDALSTLPTNGVDDPDAFPMLRFEHADGRVTEETSFASAWLGQFYAEQRRHQDGQNAALRLENIAEINAVYPLMKAAHQTAQRLGRHSGVVKKERPSSQWLYRQTLATLFAHIRLPIRSDIDFRADVKGSHQAIIDFTSLASTGMPERRYDPQKLEWVDISPLERAQMSARYNLRVGIMLAALAFGASEEIEKVAVRIDTLDGAEDIQDRDPTVFSLLLRALNQMGVEQRQHPSASSEDASSASSSVHSEQNTVPGRGHAKPKDATSGVDAQDKEDTYEMAQFMDIMRSADFSEEEIDAFRAADEPNRMSDEEVNEAFGQMLGAESSQHPEDDLMPSVQVADGIQMSIFSGPGDPLDLIRKTALNTTVAAVEFDRETFVELAKKEGLTDPYSFYAAFDANVKPDENGILSQITTTLDLRDAAFTPAGAQDEPEISRAVLTKQAAAFLGAESITDLAIQRSDVLERAQEDIAQLAEGPALSVPERAQAIAQYIDDLHDPELSGHKDAYVTNVIDGQSIDRTRFTLQQELEDVRTSSRETFMSGKPSEALAAMNEKLESLDALFSADGRVPLYFNSYAERVVYNQFFITPGEKLVLIPDTLFQCHMEMVEVLSHMGEREAALKHLNAAVRYAPVYPLPHLRLSVMLAEAEDWESSFAAASNALRVALDKDDAAYAYYRMAFAAWMQDRFEEAAACYMFAMAISESTVPGARQELDELMDRARSQDIALPENLDEASDALEYFGIDMWPFTQAADLMDAAAQASVDSDLFVAGRTLAVAAARIQAVRESLDGEDGQMSALEQAQFLRSLNA